MTQSIIWDDNLLSKYNTKGPRYTSYPTALEFSESFNESDLVTSINASDNDELAIYIHIPFCHKLCYYCGCNKIVTRHAHKAEEYLDYLFREIEIRAELMTAKTVHQVHLGGGTPSFLTDEQLSRLLTKLMDVFSFSDEAECGIELDPRSVDNDRIRAIADMGFNRMSFGVQDINEDVQVAINRVQDCEQITGLIETAKSCEVKSVNVDLIYGLPHQTLECFRKTVEFAIALQPDRLSVFSYAHMPNQIASQRKIKDEWLLTGTSKAALFRMAMNELINNDYIYLGLDHFARPDDELSLAFKAGKLHRNFQGYTTHEHCDLLGLGVSSISAIGECYSQNNKELKLYYRDLDDHQTTTFRGLKLNRDDEIRSFVIKHIMCNLSVSFSDVQDVLGIEFGRYFSAELSELQQLKDDGLIDINSEGIFVLPAGRLLIRNVAMVFDSYLHKKPMQFSATL